jgi:serine/threonine protein kinase
VLDVFHSQVDKGTASDAGEGSAGGSKCAPEQTPLERSIVIMPLEEMTTLEMLQQEQSSGLHGVSDFVAACITVCILAAIAGLAMAGYGHCDIKPDNMMLSIDRVSCLLHGNSTWMSMSTTAKSADTNPIAHHALQTHIVLVDLGACEAIGNRYSQPHGEICLPLCAAFYTAATVWKDLSAIP